MNSIEKEIDPLTIYLKQISQYKLLSAKEEKELGLLINDRKEKCSILMSELTQQYTKQEIEQKQKELEFIQKEICNFKHKMINANLRLVVSIAKKYQHRGLSLLDLIDEGNVGLIEAVNRFDITRGYRFSTYGIWWIRQAILKGIADKSRIIRIPIHMLNSINKTLSIAKTLTQINESEATYKELASYLDMTEDEVKKILSYGQDISSLDISVDDDNSSNIEQMICDESAENPIEKLFSAALIGTFNKVLQSLTNREMAILQLRYGLNGYKPLTLEETGKTLGLTRERVRQIQESAIKKLKEKEELKDFIFYK